MLKIHGLQDFTPHFLFCYFVLKEFPEKKIPWKVHLKKSEKQRLSNANCYALEIGAKTVISWCKNISPDDELEAKMSAQDIYSSMRLALKKKVEIG